MNLSSTYFHLRNGALIPDCFGILQDNINDNKSLMSEKPEVITTICDLYQENSSVKFPYIIYDFSDSHERKIHYYKFDFIPGKTLYFFCNVIADDDTEVSMIVSTYRYLRIWINGELLTINNGKKDEKTEGVILFSLKKGNNIICYEQLDPQKHHEVGIRICPIQSQNELCSIENNIGYLDSCIRIYYEICETKGIYNISYMLVPLNLININNKCSIKCVVKIKDKIIDSKVIKLFQPNNITISLDDILKYNIYSYIEFTCYLDGDTDFSSRYLLYMGDVKKTTQLINDEIKNIIKNYSISKEEHLRFEYFLDKLKCSDTFSINNMYFISELESSIRRIKLGGEYDIYSKGVHRIVIKSKLDKNLISYNVCVPSAYNKLIKYPLLVVFQIESIENRCYEYATSDILDNALIVEISGRGMTLGSYIGDATIREILSDVRKKFNIDELRIYSTGHSNGAYASWIQAQMTPHEYAGIYPSASVGIDELVANLCNTKVSFVTSQLDDSYKYSQANGNHNFDILNKYKEICIDQCTHPHFTYFNKNKFIIKELMKTSLDKYPNKVSFITGKNRYNKSYWLTVHSIRRGELYSRLDAEYSDNEIRITIENATGIQVEIPPSIDRKNFYVIINKHRFKYEDYSGNYLDYYIDVVTGKISEYCLNNLDVCDKYKGNGLLDVFLFPLNIVGCTINNNIISKVAEKFSTPSSCATINEIDIKYPIYFLEELIDKNIDVKNSFILLDNCSGKYKFSPFNLMLSECKIKTTQSGYTYENKEYFGDYIIMQVFKNPYNENCSVLYINTNNDKLYNSNIFTRKIIIPSYFYGYHPYLNNSALIFDGSNYLAVRDWGMPIELIPKNAYQFEN